MQSYLCAVANVGNGGRGSRNGRARPCGFLGSSRLPIYRFANTRKLQRPEMPPKQYHISPHLPVVHRKTIQGETINLRRWCTVPGYQRGRSIRSIVYDHGKHAHHATVVYLNEIRQARLMLGTQSPTPHSGSRTVNGYKFYYGSAVDCHPCWQ